MPENSATPWLPTQAAKALTELARNAFFGPPARQDDSGWRMVDQSLESGEGRGGRQPVSRCSSLSLGWLYLLRFLREVFDFLGKLRVGLGVLQLAAVPVELDKL
jgi:hypothetical protein